MFDAGAIAARMVLDKKDWDKSVTQIQIDMNSMTERTRELGTEMMSTGRRISQVGSRMSMLGAIVLAPVGLLIKSLSKDNAILQSKLNDVTISFQRLGAQMVGYIIPYIDRLSGLLKKMSDGFNQLPSPIKKLIVDFAVISGSLLLVTGLIVKLAGVITMLTGAVTLAALKIGSLAETLILLTMYHPVVAAITAIVVALGTIVLSSEQARNSFMDMIDTMKDKVVGMASFWQKIGAGPVASINDIIAKGSFAIGIKLAEWTAQGKNALEELSKVWNESFTVDLDKIEVTGGGSGISKWQEFSAGIKLGLEEQAIAFANFGAIAKDSIARTFTEASNTISDVFFNVLTNKFNNLQQIAVDFGNAMIKMFSEMMARLAIYYTVMVPLTSMFPGIKPAIGFAEGTESVPYTGMYKLHEGEKVTPKYDANKGAETITIVNQITPSFVNAAIASEPNTVINVINGDILRSGVTRKTIQRRK